MGDSQSRRGSVVGFQGRDNQGQQPHRQGEAPGRKYGLRGDPDVMTGPRQLLSKSHTRFVARAAKEKIIAASHRALRGEVVSGNE